MTWAFVLALALAVFAIATFAFRLPRGAREGLGAALLFGLAGYAVQAHPDLPGAPKAPSSDIKGAAGAQIDQRNLVTKRGIPPTDKWVVLADGLARNGQYANAATVLLNAVKTKPDNLEAWLAMANALVAHADGQLTPAALFAFRQAAKAEPDHPGPPFFMGAALIQAGKVQEGRALWADLLDETPADAPWRADLAARLALLDRIIAEQARRASGN